MPTSVSDPTLNRRLKGLTSALAILTVLLGYFEGDRLVAYRDVGGVWTICRGITHGVHAGQVATQEECHTMDTAEGLKSLAVVSAALARPQPPARKAALADFEYNVGEGAFRRSGVLRRINAGDVLGGCGEMQLWVYVHGVINAWQVKRRGIEHEICMQGVR